MKRSEFASALKMASIGLSNNAMLEQSDHFIIRKGKLIAYNEEICVRVPVPELSEFKGAVPGALLLKTVTSFPDSEINIEAVDHELRITGVTSPANRGIRCLDVKLSTSDVPKSGEWFELPDWFADAVAEASRCCNNDQLSGVTTCVHIGKKVVEACDNFRVYRKYDVTGFPEDFYMHCSAAAKLRGLKLEAASITNGWCHFKNGDAMVSVRGREFSEFPDLKSILKFEGRTITLPPPLADATARCAVMSDGDAESALVKVKIENGQVFISSKGVSGWAKESIPLPEGQTIEKPVIFSINPSSLIQILAQDDPVTVGERQMKVSIGGGWYCCVLQQAD